MSDVDNNTNNNNNDNSPISISDEGEENTSQLVAQLANYQSINNTNNSDVLPPTTTTTTTTTTATNASASGPTADPATGSSTPVTLAPAPPPRPLQLIAPSQPHSAQVPNNPVNATPLPKSLGGAFGAASWAADARNRKPSQNGIVQQSSNPSTPANQANGSKQSNVVQGNYISPYYMDIGGNGNQQTPWQSNQQQQRQTQLAHQLNQSIAPSPGFPPNQQQQMPSPWTPGLSNEMTTPGAPTPAADDAEDSDSDTAEHNADGTTDSKYRNRSGSRQRLSHEDKINVIRIAIELFPQVSPRWRQLNDFWLQVGTIYQERYGKSVGKIRPMADRLIKIHRAYVERCEQIPGSIRDETSMTKVLDQWIALEDPLKAMSKTWQLSQHDVDGNRSWPTKKRSREEGEEDEQPQRNGVDPNMRAIIPQSSIQSPMNNGFPPPQPPPPGFQPQFPPPQQQQRLNSFSGPPQQGYFPPDPRNPNNPNNGTPQPRPPPNPNMQYSSPYPNGGGPNQGPPTPIQALGHVEEAMRITLAALQRDQMVNMNKPAPQISTIHVEKKLEKLSKRLDKLEETRKSDMEEIRGMFGEMTKKFADIAKRLDKAEGEGDDVNMEEETG